MSKPIKPQIRKIDNVSIRYAESEPCYVFAIRQVNGRETYLPARIVQKVTEGMSKPDLSRRELEVLQDVAAGKSNKEIGVRLFIAEDTVKAHVKSLLEKLGAASWTAVSKEAVHRGFVR
jgi:DNA-binding NarL/FixJ family response regulator